MVDPSLIFPLGELPDTVFEQTLMMLSYHEIAQLRRVNKRFDTTCMALLNKGFRSAERYHTKCLKVKNKNIHIEINLSFTLFIGSQGQVATPRVRAAES